MSDPASRPARPPLATRTLLGLALAAIAIHALCLTRYGWFRDELYYVVCTLHPAAGYVDQPPLSIWALGAWRAGFGDSLAAVRVLAALAAAAAVFATGAFARDLDGGRFAQGLAALSMLAAPVYLGSQHIYSMNGWEPLLWTLAFACALSALRTNATRDWLLLGLAFGLGLLNKISVSWLVAGLVAGLLATPRRRLLLARGPWLAAGVALVVFAPYLVWEIARGFPTLEFMRNATTIKMATQPPAKFLAEQVMQMNPLLLPLWLAGLLVCLRGRGAPETRAIAVAYLVVAAILVTSRTSRPSYLAPAYPPLLAAGAVALERATSGRRIARVVRAAAIALVIASGAGLAPLALPLLSETRYVEYARALGVAPQTQERQRMGVLPQHFADMHGWDELAAEVSRIYHALPPDEQRRCVIFGQNYGEAAAVTVLGRPLGLPPAISGHNSFWLWGPGPGRDDAVLIVIGSNAEDNSRVLEHVERAGTWNAPYAMPYERDLGIFVCRGLREPLERVWPRLRLYI